MRIEDSTPRNPYRNARMKNSSFISRVDNRSLFGTLHVQRIFNKNLKEIVQ